jgi:nucleotidyltransferase substrate binding protein (TIGR01987 family)
MSTKDIRWKQRFSNYLKALSQLNRYVSQESLNELEQQGLIQAFEYTYELGWTVLKDFLEEQGNSRIYGSRDAITEGFKTGLIEDGDGWMQMFKDRNKTSHTYNEETANEILVNIKNTYINHLNAFKEKMNSLL